MPSTAVLGADVDRGPRRTLMSVGGGDVDDAAAALGLHGAYFMLHAQDHAENVGFERRRKALRSLVGDRADHTFGGGVVHCDIKAAKARYGLVDQVADISFLADVGVDEFSFRTERPQLLGELLADSVATAGNDDHGALLRECGGGGASDAGQSAGDQDNLSAHFTILRWDYCNPVGETFTGLAFSWRFCRRRR